MPFSIPPVYPEPDVTPATTTHEENLTTAGQRRINLVWEYTQAAIALMVAFATMVCGIYSMIRPVAAISTVAVPVQVPTIISVAFGTVVGFYFSRTNHAAIGGIGTKPPLQTYEGR